MKDKRMNADDAIALIRDGSTVACGGFVGSGHCRRIDRSFGTEV